MFDERLTCIFYYISAVLARMAFFPVPKRALIFPSEGLGISCWTRADLVKNLFRADSCAADLDFYAIFVKVNVKKKNEKTITYIVFEVDSISVWLKKAKSTVENVGINQLRDQVIDQFHGDFFLCVFTEKLGVRILKYHFNLHANCQHDHWHVEGHKYSLAGVFWFKFCLDLGDRDEKLLSVVHV